MPTFTTVALLENLFEPRVGQSLKMPLNGATNERQHPDTKPMTSDGAPRHLYISPDLYVTAVQAPIPQYSWPDQLSPSPYVVNQKRHRGGTECTRVEVCEVPDLSSGNEGRDLCLEEEVGDNFVNDEKLENCDDDEIIVDQRWEEEMSDTVRKQIETRSIVSAQGEFFDANDDFSSDGSITNVPSYDSRIESELHVTRFSLLEEIERRKTAEETLLLMRSEWERISNLMSQAGLTFSAPSEGMQLDNSLINQFSQEVFVIRFVAEAIGRGQARAEAEEAAVAIIESKDQEISRLCDKLQYYETVNHEMSQRKFVEVARRKQERKNSRRKWVWSFMGLSIAVGVSLVAYSYIPLSSKYLSSLKPGDSTNAPHCISPSDTSKS